jgi:hypothetical protein
MISAGGKLVLLFVVGTLLLSFPVLAIFNRPLMLVGIPILYLYLFGLWVGGIAAVFFLARSPWDDDDRP